MAGLLAVLLVMAAGLGSTGCGRRTETGALTVAGSSSVHPLAQVLAEAYEKTGTDLCVDVQSIDSTAGIQAAINGTANIGMSSRDLKTEEKQAGLAETVIALDGIAVIVHPDNTISGLTKTQIQRIFKGEILNWKEVGGADAPILVVSREEGSGTRGAFEELMVLTEKTTKDGKTLTLSLLKQDALIAPSTGEVKSNVLSKKDAIGYISIGSLSAEVKALAIDGTAATVANVKNNTYPIKRPFLFLVKTPTDGTRDFIDYVLSKEGQALVASKGFIPVQ